MQIALPETMGKSLSEVQALMSPENEATEPWFQRIEWPLYGRCYKTLEGDTVGETAREPASPIRPPVRLHADGDYSESERESEADEDRNIMQRHM